MMSFTQDERRVVLFLVAVALVGIGANFLVKEFNSGKAVSYFSSRLGKLDLNSADKKALMGISGVGEKLAQRILDYRQERQGFSEVDELKNVKGFSESKFAKIKEYLTTK